MKKVIFLIFILLLNLNCKAQTSKRIFNKEFTEFNLLAKQIDVKDKLIELEDFKINDSIKTVIKIYSSKIDTENYFERSKTETKISFYEVNSILKYIMIKEESRQYSDTDKYINYIIENNSIKDYHRFYGAQTGLALSLEKNHEDQVGLNRYLTENFYREFALNLYHKVKKNYR